MLEPVADMTKSHPGARPRAARDTSLGSPDPSGSLTVSNPSLKAESAAALVWLRRDLRIADHPALTAALAASKAVLVVFVWDPTLIAKRATLRMNFLSGCLASLDRDLRSASSGGLLQAYGRPDEVLPDLAQRVGAQVVYATGDFGPYGARRDTAVAAALACRGVELRCVGTPYAVAPGDLTTSSGAPFQVYTPFWKAWRSHGWERPIGIPAAADLARITRFGISHDARVPIDNDVDPSRPIRGEQAAHERLEAFLAGPLDDYHKRRDLPGVEGTSRLSAFVRFGCLHPRQILASLDPGSPGAEVYEKELCWREFYADVLWQRPDARHLPYRPEWSKLAVDEGPQADKRFEAWTQGRTGYPIVDAGMRQLLGEGWMHNRVRMITASFLVKDLHLDWRRGARWFMDHLVDADLASNQLGWQWVAGSGNDAAPFFRVFNPTLQGTKFDPLGSYVRRYVPELAGVDARHIHDPHELAGSLLAPPDYPAPIVDHYSERDEALARYHRMRS
jgi:deoxyribodipyrimidine photo-lyase